VQKSFIRISNRYMIFRLMVRLRFRVMLRLRLEFSVWVRVIRVR